MGGAENIQIHLKLLLIPPIVITSSSVMAHHLLFYIDASELFLIVFPQDKATIYRQRREGQWER
jgi:hypothetical protein